MKTLVIQLAKFGDLLQSRSLIERLCREGDKVSLLHNDLFSEAAHLLPVTTRYAADFSVLTELQDGKLRLEPQSATGAGFLLSFPTFDRIINLNSSPLAEDFLNRLEAPSKLGFATDDPWSNLWLGWVMSFVRARRFASLNLADIFYQLPGPETVSRVPSPMFRLRDGKLRRIALQLGSRNFKRQWPPQRFAELGDQLIHRGFALVLTGTADEADSGKRFLESIDNPSAVDNRIGQTNVAELVETLRACDALITGDTGTMHLAEYAGTPVVALFFGPAYAPETLALGGSVFFPDTTIPCHPCDETAPCPRGLACQRSITPSEIAAHLANTAVSPHAWRAETDAIGQLLVPDGDRPLPPEIALARVYRAFARQTWWHLPDTEVFPQLQELAGNFVRERQIFSSLPPDRRDPKGFRLLRPIVEMGRFRGTRDFSEACLNFLDEKFRNSVK